MTRRLAIPSSLVLRGRRWRVREMTAAERRGKHRSEVGFCDMDRRLILIDSTQTRLEQERTFVHEVLHALAGEPRDELDASAEERTILRVESGLHATLVAGALSTEDA